MSSMCDRKLKNRLITASLLHSISQKMTALEGGAAINFLGEQMELTVIPYILKTRREKRKFALGRL